MGGEPLSEPLWSLAESSTDEACVFPSSFLYTGFSCCPLLARPGNDQGAGRAGEMLSSSAGTPRGAVYNARPVGMRNRLRSSPSILGRFSWQRGRRIRVLTVIDDFTRESLATEVDISLPGLRVTQVLDRLPLTVACRS